MMPGNGFGAGDAFGGRHMRKPGRTHHITDGIHAGYVGAVVLVDLDVAAINLHSGFLETDAFHISLHTDGHKRDVALQHFLPFVRSQQSLLHHYPLVSMPSTFDFVFNPIFFLRKLRSSSFDTSSSSIGKNVVQHFDDGHLRAQRVVEIGEFHTNGACAQNYESVGTLLQRHRFEIGNHLACGRCRYRECCAGARRWRESHASRRSRPACFPSLSKVPTFVPPSSFPQAEICVTLYFLNRNATPFDILSAMPRLRPMIFAKSKERLSKLMP
jgi:hypothetical protein